MNVKYVCTYLNYEIEPLKITNSNVLCPCPKLETFTSKSSLVLGMVPLSLFMGNMVDPIYTSSLTFYDVPDVFISSDNNVLMGQTTVVNVTMTDKSFLIFEKVSCIVDPVDDVNVLSSSVMSDGVLSCLLSCEPGGGQSMLQVSVDKQAQYAFDAGSVSCISLPRIINYLPSTVMESNTNSSIMTVFIFYPVLTTDTSCLFGTIDIPIASRTILYQGDIMQMKVTCLLPPSIPPGMNVYMYVCVEIYMYLYIYMYIDVCVYICMCVYVYVYIYI
jgi:hypothetical protein